jgi:hypothetical protein
VVYGFYLKMLSWELPPENISIDNHHVHVWRMLMDSTDYQAGEMQNKLSADEINTGLQDFEVG